MKINNLTKNVAIASNVILADNFFSRLIGLLNKSSLDSNDGLILRPCNAIHTWFMKFPIDIVFIDKNNKIIFLIENMLPGRRSPIIRPAKEVIEFKAGRIKQSGSEIGDQLEIKED